MLFLSCLVMVKRLFIAVPRGCLRFVILVFPDHTHLFFCVCYAFVCVCLLMHCGHLLGKG